MKKLLSLLATGLLTLSGTTSLVACNNKTDLNADKDDKDKDNKDKDNKDKDKDDKDKDDKDKDEKEKNKDLAIFNDIIRTAKSSFEKLLFKDVILGNTPELLKGYELVSAENPHIILNNNNPDQQYLIAYYLSMFRSVYNEVNQQIINDYPNYYLDSVPLSFEPDDCEISLNFIDLKHLNSELNLKIEGIDKVKAVRVDLNVEYMVHFKSFEAQQQYQTSFNMTNDLQIFNRLHDGSFNYFQDNLLQWLEKIKLVKLNEGIFKSLYDDFYIDFGTDSKILDSKYKSSLKAFIQSNKKLSKLDITYNEQNSFGTIKNSFIKNHQKTDKGLGPDFGNNFDYLMKNRLFRWGGDKPTTAKAKDFVKNYKEKLVPKLNETKNKMLNLATLTLKLNYINFYGMTLKGYVKDNKNITFETIVTLTEAALDTKLTNFANIIIAFLNFYNTSDTDGINFEFHVNENDFKQIVKNGLKSINILKSLITIFKTSSVAKTLPDINLVNLSQLELMWSPLSVFEYDGPDHLVSDKGVYDATFIFGTAPSEFYYTIFHHFYISNEWDLEDHFSIRKI